MTISRPSGDDSVQAPRYGIIPAKTDLDMLQPIPEMVFPVIPAQSRTFEDLGRKGEVVADSVVVGDGDELDVIAPVDILKQIFKIPCSKAQILIDSPDRRARGVRFFRRCLDFLDEPHHLVVRALAHGQLARLLLLSDDELCLASDAVQIDYEVFTADDVSISYLADSPGDATPNIPDLVSSRRDAVYHASEAVRCIRLAHLQNIGPGIVADQKMDSCACGNVDCFEVCAISQWIPNLKLDEISWKSLLLLGCSYLALGHAYRDKGQPFDAFRAVELACMVYGAMPEREIEKFDSSISCESLAAEDCVGNEQLSMNSPFWSRAWTLAGELYGDFHEILKQHNELPPSEKNLSQLSLSPEVLNEIERLTVDSQKCSACSLVNCSCESERGKTGSSATSSSKSAPRGKHIKKRNTRKSQADVAEHRKGETVSSSKSSGIFKFISKPKMGSGDLNLTNAIACYEEAIKVLRKSLVYLEDFKLVSKKKARVWNLLAQSRLARNEWDEAESFLKSAVLSLKDACDCTDIITVYCSLGFSRREAALDLESVADELKSYGNVDQVPTIIEKAKTEFRKALRYYGLAKMNLDATSSEVSASKSQGEVYGELARTYLDLSSFLKSEDSTAEVYNVVAEKETECKIHKISAKEAASEALNLFELLGDSYKSDAGNAHFQLGCLQREHCLKMLKSATKNQKIGQILRCAEEADSSWRKSLDVVSPTTETGAYLSVLMDQAELLYEISDSLDLSMLLVNALTKLFEGRRVPEIIEPFTGAIDNGEVCSRFWIQLRRLLVKMSITAARSTTDVPWDTDRLEKIKAMSLECKVFSLSQLQAMHSVWTS